MRNRYILLLVSFVCCLNVWGGNFGSDGTIHETCDQSCLPGGYRVYEEFWNRDYAKKTTWTIPSNTTQLTCNFAGGDVTKFFYESDMDNADNIISVSCPNFNFEWKSAETDHGHYTLNHASGAAKRVGIGWDLEWSDNDPTQGDRLWNPNPEEVNQDRREYEPKTSNHHQYKWNVEIEGCTIKINAKKIWEKAMLKEETSTSFKKNGYVDFYFRIAFADTVDYILNNEHSKQARGFFHTNTVKLRVYKCDPGKLSVQNVGGVKNPEILLNGEGIGIYAIYEGQNSTIDVVSNVERSIKESSICDSVNTSEVKIQDGEDIPPTKGEWKHSINISYFKEDSKLKPGNKYTVKRSISITPNGSTNILTCESNSLEFMVLPKPSFKALEYETSSIVCKSNEPGKEALMYDLGNYISDQPDKYKLLHGAQCKFGNDDEFKDYESTYGVEYRWVYWTKTNGNHKLIDIKETDVTVPSDFTKIYDVNNDENGPDLTFPLYTLKEGETYYFAQRVYFKNFKDQYVESDEYYTIKISKALDSNKLSVDISQTEACEEDNLMDVVFKAQYGQQEDPKDYVLDDDFNFVWKINGVDGESKKEVYETRNFEKVSEDITYEVSLSDGCGNTIKKEAKIHVNALPSFTAENIKNSNGNISLTIKDDGSIKVIGLKNRECKLVISDSEKDTHDYFYSLYDDGSELVALSGTTYKETSLQGKTIYFYKKSKSGEKCLSNPVKVELNALSDLEDNTFLIKEIYVCEGSYVPELNSNNGILTPTMSGVDSRNIEYSWEYSTDNMNWYKMTNVNEQGDESYFTKSNYDGTWKREIKSTTYIRRVATPKLSDETVLGNYESDVLTVNIYSKPSLTLKIDGSLAVDPKCYGDNIKLSMSINNSKLADEEKVMSDFNGTSCLSRYGYYDFDGEKYTALKTFTDINDANAWQMDVTRNYNIYSGVEYCGDTIFSKPIFVETQEQIDVTPTLGPCKVVGNEVTITAVKDGHTCEIRRGEETFPAVDGVSTAKILLDSKKDYNYEVEVTNNKTGCKVVLNKSISASEVLEKNTSVSIGPSGDASNTTICAGTKLTIKSSVTEDKQYLTKTYSWSVNNKIQTGETEDHLEFTAEAPGTEYTIERTRNYYEQTTFCYSVVDKTTLTTQKPLVAPTIALSSESICNGEQVVITATANGGGSESEYYLYCGKTQSNIAVKKGGKYEFKTTPLTKDTTISVYVTDNTCSSDIYKATSEETKVVVEKDLAFTINPSQKIITSDDYTEDVTVRTISIQCVGAEENDTLYYKLNGGEETKVIYNGSGFSIKISKAMFDESVSVELEVRRVGTSVGKCESTSFFNFRLNEGFEGAPLLEKDGKQEIEICEGETLDLEVTGVENITFNGAAITEMDNWEWILYKGNSIVDRVSKKDEKKPNFELKNLAAGTTNRYYVVFKGEDAGGTVRRVSSNDFIVKCGLGVNVGNIHFDEYQNQTFMEFCENSDSIVRMSGTMKAESVKSMQWKYNMGDISDENDWKDVPENVNNSKKANTNNITVVLSELVNNLKGEDGKMTTDRVYFRLYATDNCDSESMSDNILLIRFKTNVDMPKPSLSSAVMYGSEVEFPDSMLFSRHWSHSDPYEYLRRGDVADLGGSLQRVYFNDLQFGENSVDVVRSEKARISEELCYSDTLHYTFNIYQKLSTPTLAVNPSQDYYCAKDGEKKNLYLNRIMGGDTASYKTVWQYQMEGIDEWIAMDNGENHGVFNVTIGKIKENEDNEHQQQIIIKDLSQSIKVRAMLTCGGDYPGGYVSSNEVSLNVYAPMKDGGIDFSEKEICYNTPIDEIKGFEAEGGSGRYSYVWQKSTDKSNYVEMDNGKANNPSLIVKNFNGEQNLKKTTYFRRIVTDEVCGTKDTSVVKTVFVTDDFQITAEDVEYSHVVSNMSRASMVGVTDFSKSGTGDIQYVWYKSGSASAIVYDQSAVDVEVKSEALVVPKGDDGYTETYYVQAIKEGCKSSNKLELSIYVYNQTGGTLSLDGHDSSEEVIWVCSGEEDLNVICDGSAPNADYLWYYVIDEKPYSIWGVYNGKTTSKVTTADIRLDTTNMTLSPFPLRNTLGGTKKVKIFRETSIDELNLTLFSDTLTINIVPTLESVSNALFTNSTALAGEIEIETGKKDYCIGDEPNSILGYIDPVLGEYWEHYKEYLGPWLYDKSIAGGFKTYYEYQINDGEWIKETEYDYSKKSEYAGKYSYSIGEYLDGSYRIHRVLEDGCSSMTSNEVLLSLFDKVLDVDTVSTYAYTPEMTTFNPNNAIRSGYEVGDSIVFTSKDKNLANLVWYSDPQCTEVLADDKSYCGMRLTEELANEKEGEGAYIYVRARSGDCFGEIVAVPFEFGTLSDGGTIYISESIICHNGLYEDIIGEGEAKGQYKAPVYGPMKWSYSWQYKRSESEKATWSTIADETGLGLSADVINDLSATANSSDSPLLIRRVATNDKGRVRYSNVLTLTRYSVLKPGVLSLNGDQNSFCTYDELSYVKTTDPSGGKANGNYGLIWQYNVNNGEWKDFVCSDSLYIGHIAVELDRKINNNVNFRCKYTDDCESVFSNEVTVTLFRINESPTFYQNNDSCNAEVVKLLVNKEEIQKTYHWSAIYIDPEDDTYTEKTIWNYVGEDCMIVRNGMPTTTYAVRSEDNETKCLSKLYYFDVDSLPDLTQNSFDAPIAICDGSDLEIKGGVVSGGNGEKTYQWQMSSTGNDNDFADIVDATSNDLNLSAKYMKTGSYFRRIVVDMCDTDTSDVIFVDVRQKVSVSSEDLAFDDFKCPNGIFTAKVVAEADSTMLSEYWTLDNDTIFTIGKNFQMEGFAGDSMEYQFVHYLTDTTGLTCPSEAVSVYAYNKPSINKEENIISTDNFTPCNESQVKIEGSLLGGSHSEHIKYNWYVNGNEQIGEFKNNLRFTANDDMVVVRIADNGCVTDSSNVLHLEGQIVFAYDYANELSMEVLTDVSDSSVVINILGSKLFSEGYEFTGDGDMPNVASNNIVLPYKFDIYKDSLLGIMAKVPYCVRSLAINPLRGGVISFDGGDQLCGGEEVAPIVVTELEGGSGNPTYQWQYKNERTPDFINIDGATSKSYTPSAVDVATTYRRIAVDGIYKSISNELTISIRPMPTVALVDNSYSLEELSDLSLYYRAHSYYQWVDNMEMYLIDSAMNADQTHWQISYDQESWLDVAKDKDSLLLTDQSDVAYYRYVAINTCGADTSEIVKLEKRLIDPIADDQIIWWLTDTFVCRNEQKRDYLRFNLFTDNRQGSINPKYMYSYRVESNSGAFVWKPMARPNQINVMFDSIFTENTLMKYYYEIRISEMDENGNKRIPSDNVVLYVTRHDTLRGTAITRAINMNVNTFDATYAMIVEDGSEIRVGEKDVIQLKQGDRVRFVPKVTSNIEYGYGDLQYNWSLEQPLNKNYFSVYGGRNGIEGITSEKESPICYYYNGGRYPVTLKVTDGVCEKFIRDTSLYIPENSLRRFSASLVLEDEMQDGDFKQIDYIDVFPTYVTEFVNVVSTGNATHNVMLVDEVGRILYGEKFSGSVQVPMSGCISGTYFIVVDELERFKIIKR